MFVDRPENFEGIQTSHKCQSNCLIKSQHDCVFHDCHSYHVLIHEHITVSHRGIQTYLSCRYLYAFSTLAAPSSAVLVSIFVARRLPFFLKAFKCHANWIILCIVPLHREGGAISLISTLTCTFITMEMITLLPKGYKGIHTQREDNVLETPSLSICRIHDNVLQNRTVLNCDCFFKPHVVNEAIQNWCTARGYRITNTTLTTNTIQQLSTTNR